jgi:MFS family permease
MKTISVDGQSNYRWYLLGLSAATSTFVTAIPFACMPVLFEEISNDLGLSLVQIGTVWGIASLAGVFVSLAGGIIGDRFGLKSVLGISCLLVGITGALRGLSTSFVMLATIVFLNGIVRAVIPINVTKTIAVWFGGRNLGMANGVGAMGMGLGLMLGPLISATIMSPLLGGWRNVMFLYGGLSVTVAVIWFLFGKGPAVGSSGKAHATPVPFKTAFPGLVRNKAVWLVGLTLLFRMGGITGMTGYLPLYLRGQGWPAASADGTLAVFYAVSTLSVIPVSTLSDRIGMRKAILLAGLVVMTASLVLLPQVGGSAVWGFMIVSGIFMDSFMSIIITMLMETKGVGVEHAGTALGMVFTIAPIGAVIAPPLGNGLARIDPGLPFVFWAAMSLLAVVTLSFTSETGWRRNRRYKTDGGQATSPS